MDSLNVTRTLGFNHTPSLSLRGLSVCMRQHSELSRWCFAKLSGMALNFKGVVIAGVEERDWRSWWRGDITPCFCSPF